MRAEDILDPERLKALRKKLGITAKVRAKPRELERIDQVAVINWARAMERVVPMLADLHAIPNGGHRHPIVAKKMKAEGVLAGVSDLCLPCPSRNYHGLYIEMKSEDGTLTEAQSAFLNRRIKYGYCAAVCHSAKDGIAALEWYCGLTEYQPKCIIF